MRARALPLSGLETQNPVACLPSSPAAMAAVALLGAFAWARRLHPSPCTPLHRASPFSCSRFQVPLSRGGCETPLRWCTVPGRSVSVRSSASSAEAGFPGSESESEETSQVSLDAEGLQRFVEMNAGEWEGTFVQFDLEGQPTQKIPVALSASTHGKGDAASLQQTLRVKPGPLKGEEPVDSGDKADWAEYKIPEMNRITVDTRHQVGFFDGEGAYAVSHLTAEILGQVLRSGVLGEDASGEDQPLPGVKLPSDRPALVSEACLSNPTDKGSRVRAFHVLDARGVMDSIGVFVEAKDGTTLLQVLEEFKIEQLVGQWEGSAHLCRSDLYGGSKETQKARTRYSIDGDTVTVESEVGPRRLQSRGSLEHNILSFSGGLRTLFLPGGLSLAFPQVVPRGNSFFFEFGWTLPGGRSRQRIVRTYDPDGMVVSTTLICEDKTK